MIRLIRAGDGMEILLNAAAISSYIEEDQKTLICLLDGEKIEVKNRSADIKEKIDAWQKGMTSDDPPARNTDLQEV